METEKTVVVRKSQTSSKAKAETLKEPIPEVNITNTTTVIPDEIPEVNEPKKADNFSEKQAKAAATMALKSAIEANSEMAMRDAERTYALEKQKHMLSRCKNDKVVTRTISKLYAPYLGKVYTFAYNGVPVTIYCDGKPHEYPEFVARHIDAKLNKISESNTYKEIIEERFN